MHAPKITLRKFSSFPALTTAIEEKAAQIKESFPRATSCEVVIDAPTKHHRHGATFAARVDVTIPGAMVVGRANDAEAPLAVKRAFDAARQRLTETLERRRTNEEAYGTVGAI